jgi:hypothetical protein
MQHDANLERVVAAAPVEQGLDVDGVDPELRDRFEPDGLPDAGRAVIVDTLLFARDRLLTTGLPGILPVFHPQDDPVRPRPQIRRDVQAEWDVAAPVLGGFLAVDPNGRDIIDRPEVQKQVAVGPILVRFELPGIPDSLVDRPVSDTGKATLVGEGHEDAVRQPNVLFEPPVSQSDVAIVESELPFAVQRDPFATNKIRPWIFGSGFRHGCEDTEAQAGCSARYAFSMRRPEPTKREIERFTKASKFRYRLELILDFDHPVSLAEGREVARKTMESIQATTAFAAPEELGEIRLSCSELRKIVRVKVETP